MKPIQKRSYSLLLALTLLTCVFILIVGYDIEESKSLFLTIVGTLLPSSIPGSAYADMDDLHGLTDLDKLTNACNKGGESNPLFPLQLAPKCRAMFYDGSLVRPDHWETTACKSLDYTWRDLNSCLRQKDSIHDIAIIGDSRMRQLANMFLNYMKNTTTPTLLTRFHEDIVFEEKLLNLKIHVFWQTFINKKLVKRFSNWLSESCVDVPDMVIIGVGTWYLKAEADEFKRIAPQVLSQFEAGLRKLSHLMKTLNPHIPIIWVGQAPAFMHWRPNVSFRNITDYNAVTEKILNQTGVIYWKSAYTIGDQMFHQSPDVNHYSDNVTKALVNVLWNFYCNSKINISSDHCCVTTRD